MTVSSPPTTDRRRERHLAKKAMIVGEAWTLAQRNGLAAITLRDLAEQVGLRQPSLYAYFDSKLALYDAMFADGNRQLIEHVSKLPARAEPEEALVEFVVALTRFAAADTVRHQLLFQRTIPGFEPSPDSYAVAEEFYAVSQARLAAVGVVQPGDVDLFTAVVAGLAHQQVANDPGGARWVRLSRRAVGMYLAETARHRGSATPTKKSPTKKSPTKKSQSNSHASASTTRPKSSPRKASK